MRQRGQRRKRRRWGVGIDGNRIGSGRRLLRRWSQQLTDVVETGAAGRTEEAIVTDLRKTFGRDVLKEAVNELGGGKRDMASLLSVVVGVAKTDDAVIEGFQPTVGDGNAEDVAGQIVEHLVAAAGVLGMDDPAKLPDGGRNESKESGLFQTVTEFGAEDDR